MEPVLGKAGDVIFFDTNAAHRAGIVSEGFERNVIRFDFNVRGFNPQKSFIQRFFSVVSSRLR
jgi:ectoine hydroxylase-related dioxygenase (phytanoyl-CoA dioxygenase family)